MSDILVKTKALYDRKNYRLALDLLEPHIKSHAFSQIPIPQQIAYLDLLAALYEKHGKLQKARLVSNQLINFYPKDIRGYLRLGKVLQMSDKVSESVKVYKRALLTVSPLIVNHKLFLQKQIDCCEQKKRQSMYVDFISRLPVEVLDIIFAHLSFKDKVNCYLVSKSWMNFTASRASFWSHLDFSANTKSTSAGKSSILTPKTIAKYLDLSVPHQRIDLDLSTVMVRSPELVLNTLVRNPMHAPRLASLHVNLQSPQSIQPIVRMIRKSSLNLTSLTSLSMFTSKPDYDVQWLIDKLPQLTHLELVSTQHALKPFLKHLECTTNADFAFNSKLRTLMITGYTGEAIFCESFLTDLLKIKSLENIDLHRCVNRLWPALNAACFENHQLARLGFTASGVKQNDEFEILPKFLTNLESVTLNNVNLTLSGTPFHRNFTDLEHYSIKYLEMKRTNVEDLTLPQLLNFWKCEYLETLVINASNFGNNDWPELTDPRFKVLNNLHTIQFTNMYALSEDVFGWIINACPNLRKINLDGTVITGPQLVRLLSETSIVAIRCKSAVDVNASTVQWIKSLNNRSVIF